MLIDWYWLIAAFAAGYIFCLIRMSFDKDIVTLSDDEMVVKRPHPGFVIAQVPPDVVREMIKKIDKKAKGKTDMVEARDLYEKKTIVELSEQELSGYFKK
jgi:hypothetical protein